MAKKKKPTEFDKLLEKDIKTKTIKAKKEKGEKKVKQEKEKKISDKKARQKKFDKGFIRKTLKKTEQLQKRGGKKYMAWGARPVVSKKVIRKAPRATLDLRRHEREPLKQHGFKEVEISHSNFLFN